MSFFNSFSKKEPDLYPNIGESAQNSVCSIIGVTKELDREYYSHGVFIAPDTVLTAGHCLQNFKRVNLHEVDVINSQGESGRVVKRLIPSFKTTIDLAVVKLDQSIGPENTPPFLTMENFARTPTRLTLVSRFNGVAECHPVLLQKLDMFFCSVFKDTDVMFSTAIDSNSGLYVGPGYSGSPIFDNHGRVTSIVTCGIGYEGTGKVELNPPLFGGVLPRSLAKFISSIDL
ncbi:MAG: serine protease [Alphaproteobacteria bacterium]|nr:serine protease [Alphaproteobacteria bacterium]